MQFRKNRKSVGGAVQQRGLGDLEFQPRGRKAAVGNSRTHHLHQNRIPELDARQIDRDSHVCRPVHRLGAGLPQHPCANRHDQSGFLGNRDEPVRTNHAKHRMVPAQQRLERAELIGGKVVLRLVGQFERLTPHRVPQVVFQHHPLLQVLVHRRPEEAPPSFVLHFRPIQRGIGAFEQCHGRGCIQRRQRDADAGADADDLTIEVERLAQCMNDALRHDRSLFGLLDPHQHRHELIAPQAADRIDLAHAVQQPLRDRLQQQIAGRVPKRVVDRLETVEVQAKRRR